MNVWRNAHVISVTMMGSRESPGAAMIRWVPVPYTMLGIVQMGPPRRLMLDPLRRELLGIIWIAVSGGVRAKVSPRRSQANSWAQSLDFTAFVALTIRSTHRIFTVFPPRQAEGET